jgi:hypothetical protein
MMDRRDFLRTSFAAAAGLALRGVVEPLGSASASTLLPVEQASCRWGAFADPVAGQTSIEAYAAFEKKTGRKLAITREYLSWDAALPGKVATWSAQGGRIPYISFKALHSNGDAVRWAAIASGSKDDFIRSQADRMRAWGHEAYVSFHHEPEDDPVCGSASDFRAAYARIKRIFENHGVNVRWVVALMASTYAGGHGGFHPWFPPDFDLVGIDGYNRFPCVDSPDKHPWRSFKEIFAPGHDAAVATRKHMLVGEVGCVEQDDCGNTSGDPRAKARWITHMGETLAGWPAVHGVLYSHTTLMHDGFPMDYRVDSSTAALDAYRTLGSEEYFYGPAT